MAMSSSSGFDHRANDYYSQPRGFFTPPPTWRTNRHSPAMPRSEKIPKMTTQSQADVFHVIHKVPSGDSPYVRAKHVQLIEKDPSRAVSLFWAAINSGDRVDSALKDMAVVMKQLDRSDEAIEAIKSFRHLSPPESQESLDNILVELYKQSGRIEEEIDMLKLKLKQVEEGLAFCGKRTKIARSQGKKIQITVEKEYSRLLGNLAWAYMQQKDFKSAEEHYRKALSFEPDKNKQCNLAVCLMHMNKLTEAKFLLQTVRGNGCVDESYAKSYERASQMLVEFESQHDLNDNNRAFTEFSYDKRADFDWRSNHYEHEKGGHKRAYEFPFCSRATPKALFTQPRRRSRSDYQRKGANGSYSRKLSFGSSTGTETVESYIDRNAAYYSTVLRGETPKIMPQFSVKPVESNEEVMILPSEAKNDEDLNLEAGFRKILEIRTGDHKKSWADMVEEDEQELSKSWRNDESLFFSQAPIQEGFNDENLDTNIIIPETPKSCDEADKLSRKIESVDLGSGYFTQPEKTMNQSVRRSLCFDQNEYSNIPESRCTSPLTTKVLTFEGQGALLSEDVGASDLVNRRRLQVFQDITRVPGTGSPRP